MIELKYSFEGKKMYIRKAKLKIIPKTQRKMSLIGLKRNYKVVLTIGWKWYSGENQQPTVFVCLMVYQFSWVI